MLQPPAIRLARTETKLFMREPVAVFFSLMFPLILLLFLGSLIAEEAIDDDIRAIDAFIPAMVALTAANTGVLGLAIHVAENRGRGVLRRLRLTPIRDLDYFLAQMITNTVVLVVAMVLLTAFVFGIYGPTADPHWLPLIGTSLFAIYVMFSMGVLVGGLRMPVRSVQVLSATLFFLMFFASGVVVPRQGFPDWLFTISEFNPLSHLYDFALHAYLGQTYDGWHKIGVVLALGLVMNLITWKTFDWEGRT